MRYSYSNLATWQKCPRQWEAKYIHRTMPFVETDATRRGKQVHAHLEDCIKVQADPPLGVWLPDGLLPLLHLAGARAEVELEIHEPRDLIGFIDVLTVNDGEAYVIDWKTGKLRPDPLQADVYAMLLRRTMDVDRVTFSWVGVDAQKVQTCEPDDKAEARVMEIIGDIETSPVFPPTPSWLCRFCPLEWCEHNEKRS